MYMKRTKSEETAVQPGSQYAGDTTVKTGVPKGAPIIIPMA